MEDLGIIIEWFYRICLRRRLKVNAIKEQFYGVCVVGGENETLCDIEIQSERLEQLHEFMHLL